jgi:hypothetical protein
LGNEGQGWVTGIFAKQVSGRFGDLSLSNLGGKKPIKSRKKKPRKPNHKKKLIKSIRIFKKIFGFVRLK